MTDQTLLLSSITLLPSFLLRSDRPLNRTLHLLVAPPTPLLPLPQTLPPSLLLSLAKIDLPDFSFGIFGLLSF
jgi:hypothetical protein